MRLLNSLSLSTIKELNQLVTADEYFGHNSKFSLTWDKIKEEGVVMQLTISRFVQSAGKLVRVEEEYLTLYEQIRRLNNTKIKIEKDIETTAHYYVTYDLHVLSYHKI